MGSVGAFATGSPFPWKVRSTRVNYLKVYPYIRIDGRGSIGGWRRGFGIRFGFASARRKVENAWPSWTKNNWETRVTKTRSQPTPRCGSNQRGKKSTKRQNFYKIFSTKFGEMLGFHRQLPIIYTLITLRKRVVNDKFLETSFVQNDGKFSCEKNSFGIHKVWISSDFFIFLSKCCKKKKSFCSISTDLL